MPYKSPQIFHNKEDKPKNDFVLYPNDLFSAINTIFSGSEAIVLLAWLGCKGDGSFSPNISYILKLTGISKAENYYRVKRNLIKSKYVTEGSDGSIHIDTTKIIDAWKNGTTKTDRKAQKRKIKDAEGKS